MRTKPSSASNCKPNKKDDSIINKKPTIVKCFICNQMYYSQQTFDSHMDQHQKKVNKNLPQEIQRKTLQSFGVKRKQSINKKNTTLEAINQNQITDKKILSKTLKLPILNGQKFGNIGPNYLKQVKPLMMKKQISKSPQFPAKKQETVTKIDNLKKQPQDKQIQQIDEAIRESSILMNQIAFLTEQSDYGIEINAAEQVESDQQQDGVLQRTISQHQFVHFIRQNNSTFNKLQEQLLKTLFAHEKQLQNCQIQVEYLNKITKLSTDPKSIQKINKIKSKILTEVINLIMANEAPKTSVSKTHKIQDQKQVRQQENLQVRTCSYCLDMVGFGQVCIIQDTQFYHKNCYSQK